MPSTFPLQSRSLYQLVSGLHTPTLTSFPLPPISMLTYVLQHPFQETAHAALFSAVAALPKICAAMSLYLDNPATEGILFHPVQRRVVDVVDWMRELLQRLHSNKVGLGMR